MINGQTNNEVSIHHIAEVYLYEYYICSGNYSIIEEDKLNQFLDEGNSYFNNGDFDKALDKYAAAQELNPVSFEIFRKEIKCYRELKRFEEMKKMTLRSFNFCCTRNEMASFYRNLGFYYLETYKPDLAGALYRYSLFFGESETAHNEINYLETAMKKKYSKLSVDDIQTLLDKNNIPKSANSVTLALLVKAGDEALSKNNRIQALDCYKMVYDLSYDDEIKEMIDKIQIVSNDL